MAEHDSNPIGQAENTLKITKPPSPEILKKFSTGKIQLSNDLEINGEGQDRTLDIVLRSDDPPYADYIKDCKLFADLITTNNAMDRNQSVSDAVLDMMNSRKRMLKSQAVHYKLLRFMETSLAHLTEQLKNTPQGQSTQRLTVLSQIRDFNELFEYTIYIAMKSTRIILPEQESEQGLSQG